MSVKDQMLQARKLIGEKRYDEARIILEKIEHPKAKQWLKQIDARSAQNKGHKPLQKSRTSKQSPKAKTPKTSSSRRYLLPLIVMLLLIAVIAGVATVLLPNLTSNSASIQSTASDADATNIADSQIPTNNNADSQDDSDGPIDASINNTSTDLVGSGLRLPILRGSDFMFTAELPEGYECECDIVNNKIYSDDRFNYFQLDVATRAFQADYFIDKTIDEVLAEVLRDDETISGQETVQVNGRDVVIARITDEDNDTEISYNVKDSNGYAIRVIIPNWIDEPELLHEATLFVAGNVEGAGRESATVIFDSINESAVSYDEASNLWYFNDLLDASRQNSVELPTGWVFDTASIGFRMAIKDGDSDTSATAIVSMQTRVFDDSIPFAQWISDYFAEQDELPESEEVVSVGEREVVIRVEYDADVDQRTTNYYVKDSDGDLIALITQPFVIDQAEHRDDILLMARSVESEEISWEEQLTRIGVIEK